MAGPSPLVPILLTLAAVLLSVGFALSIFRYFRAPRPRTVGVIAALAVGLATVGGVWAYTAYQTYTDQDTWGFGYDLEVQGNGTGPESLIVPVTEDESLLAGLRLASGAANWSFVTTPMGRGLFVRFTGAARIGTSVSVTPRPTVLPDTNPTMTVSNNCTAGPSNCTGLPGMWIFYSGPAGAHFSLSVGSVSTGGYLAVGWATYETQPPAMPTS